MLAEAGQGMAAAGVGFGTEVGHQSPEAEQGSPALDIQFEL